MQVKIEKMFDEIKLNEFFSLFNNRSKITKIINTSLTFVIDDSENDMIDYVNANFEDYTETELRLDALEAQIIGEQSTFSKIREALKL